MTLGQVSTLAGQLGPLWQAQKPIQLQAVQLASVSSAVDSLGRQEGATIDTSRCYRAPSRSELS